MAKQQRICSIPDCGKRHFGGGLCNAHYQAKRRAADPGYVKRVFERREKRQCAIDGCEKLVRYGALCSAHYTRKHRHGDPHGGGTGHGEPLRWIHAHAQTETDDCIFWPYARGGAGDALVTVDGQQVSAPRYLCSLVHGDQPDDKIDTAHSCGNGHLGCMNARHVRWATRRENMLDKHEHGTMARGERSKFAKLTKDQVVQIRSLKGKMTLDEIGEMFNVHRATISLIHLRKNWAWLPD